jgi:hypothetical protein
MRAPKVTDTQRRLLTSATQRDGLVILPARLKGAAATKVVRSLLARGLVREVPSEAGQPSWRPGWALVITAAGRAAI